MAQIKFGKAIDQYTDIFRQALKLAWKERSLWFFGFFTAIIYTGSVFSGVVTAARSIEPADAVVQNMLRTFSPLAPWIHESVSHLMILSATRVVLTVSISLAMVFFLVLVLVCAQKTLIEGLTSPSRKHRSIKYRMSHLTKASLKDLFAADVLTLTLFTLVLMASTVPLSLLLNHATTVMSALVFTAFYALIIPVAFLIDSIGMFTMIHVVRDRMHVVEAVAHSATVLRKHWLVVLEVAILLYLINLIIPVVVQLPLVLFSLFVAVLAFISLSTGTTILMMSFGLVAVLCVLIVICATIGFLITFNYAVWLSVINRLERRHLIPFVEHLGSRVKKIMLPLS